MVSDYIEDEYAGWPQGNEPGVDQREEMMSNDTGVYKAINAVQAALAGTGISKGRTNEQQHYKFRGIDDVYNAVSRLLAANGLCIMPRCTEREVVERTSAKGGALFYVTVKCEFDFIAATDGSRHTVSTYGEAMDSGDKATNKAMSAAYKYALMQTFAIPTEGDNDADATTHEVAGLTPAQQTALQELRDAALNGIDALHTAWSSLPEKMRTILKSELAGLKDAARKSEIKVAA
jgi:hypothetical protein